MESYVVRYTNGKGVKKKVVFTRRSLATNFASFVIKNGVTDLTINGKPYGG
jgi:hypothetical protein